MSLSEDDQKHFELNQNFWLLYSLMITETTDNMLLMSLENSSKQRYLSVTS